VPRVRRASHVFFRCRDAQTLDIESLLKGRLSVERRPELVAISLLTGDELGVTREELDLLTELPADWVDEEELPEPARQTAHGLARRGLVISDESDPDLERLRSRDERLAGDAWHPYAALYHFGTRDRVPSFVPLEPGEDGPVQMTAAALQAFVDRFGPPPPPFSEPAGTEVVELPLHREDMPLVDVLRKRRTTRAFNAESLLPLDQLSIVLDSVFGCLAYVQIGDDLAVRKSSPSGGGLHPIEVYPLVVGVESLETGVYHYRPRTHELALLHPLDRAAARRFATVATAGQTFLASAHVLFLLTARFYRSFWKYRAHDRAYAVLLMDAAHLSQTLYVMCTALGLGAFVTGAIDRVAIEDRLGVDAFGEGAIAAAGCGIPAAERLPGEPEFTPYVPRETELP
jgi:putative peptide maturation dehydrogenase